ncbi:sensor histidine kinase [Terrimonas ferruginea]|uniref:sensor histidine kinase n=1 Tax=Terrimonas ferruginea TaxID=249 RepID=UPI000421B0C0|nr:histidine kinase [Terrimonas ferruginea]
MNGILKKSWFTSILIILSYLGFWVIVLQFAGMQKFWDGFKYYLWQVLYIGATGFTLYHFAFPLLRQRRTKWLFLVVVLSSLLLMTVGYIGWIWLGGMVNILQNDPRDLRSADFIARTLIFEIFSLAYFASIRLYIDSVQLRLAHKQLEVERKISELNYLKSQTNPHFLFNTLNNIYALSRKNSEKAPQSLLRLSTLLRYMLYETSAHRIPVQKEISIIEDYLQLEKLRYDGSLELNFTHDLENKNALIPPLILLPLVENAFKHGASETQHRPFVYINLSIKEQHLYFVVKNSYSTEELPHSGYRGIGLHNLQQHLRLLYTDYSLDLKPGTDSFNASLIINLSSHASL